MKIVEISLKSAESTDESIVSELQVDAAKGDQIVLKKDWTTFSQFSVWMRDKTEKAQDIVHDQIQKKFNAILTSFEKMTTKFGKDLDKIFDAKETSDDKYFIRGFLIGLINKNKKINSSNIYVQ